MKKIGKTEVKNIKQAILIFKDPKTGTDRRIIFGDGEDLLSLFTENAPRIYNTLRTVKQKKPENYEAFESSLAEAQELNEEVATVNNRAFSIEHEMFMNLVYEVYEDEHNNTE
jgi:hypothetical protein